MKCQFCENEATVTYTLIVDGVKRDTSLCQSCAEERGLFSHEALPDLKQIFGTTMDKEPVEVTEERELSNDASCEQCDFTLEQVREIGRFGCPHCYEVFGEYVARALEEIHGSVEHVGYRPEGSARSFEQHQEMEALQAELEKAIADEAFEKAAQLRDSIKKLQSASASEGGQA